jgi:hypothetical protein
MTITDDIQDAILKIPSAWTPAYDAEGQDGAWVAEITGMLDLPRAWSPASRVRHAGHDARLTSPDRHAVSRLTGR